MLWLGYTLPVVVFAGVVLLSPDDVLQRYPALRVIADRIQAALLHSPMKLDIYVHARSTHFPQVAQLASALAVLATIYIATVSFIRMTLRGAEVRELLRRSSPRFIDRLGLLCVAPFGLFLLWAFFCLPGDPSFGHGLTATRRGGYAFFASVSILAAGAGLGGLRSALLSILDYLRGPKGDRHEG
jgi:hypothetical protein